MTDGFQRPSHCFARIDNVLHFASVQIQLYLLSVIIIFCLLRLHSRLQQDPSSPSGNVYKAAWLRQFRGNVVTLQRPSRLADGMCQVGVVKCDTGGEIRKNGVGAGMCD